MIDIYWVPTLSYRGWITWWPGKSAKWRKGFVVRIFWLGIAVRWEKVK